MLQRVRYNPDTGYEEVSKNLLGVSESVDYQTSGLKKVSKITKPDSDDGWIINDKYYDFSPLHIPKDNKNLSLSDGLTWW